MAPFVFQMDVPGMSGGRTSTRDVLGQGKRSPMFLCPSFGLFPPLWNRHWKIVGEKGIVRQFLGPSVHSYHNYTFG